MLSRSVRVSSIRGDGREARERVGPAHNTPRARAMSYTNRRNSKKKAIEKMPIEIFLFFEIIALKEEEEIA